MSLVVEVGCVVDAVTVVVYCVGKINAELVGHFGLQFLVELNVHELVLKVERDVCH